MAEPFSITLTLATGAERTYTLQFVRDSIAVKRYWKRYKTTFEQLFAHTVTEYDELPSGFIADTLATFYAGNHIGIDWERDATQQQVADMLAAVVDALQEG